ncbi:hypothetical protein EDM00_10640 [Ornithobacterium rhinotracheale]|nr:hypothetical protein [Ornithobacterium rhinotracheale]MRJ09398.1 hypothetical protein [Ornithobacterium rhinotracheale]
MKKNATAILARNGFIILVYRGIELPIKIKAKAVKSLLPMEILIFLTIKKTNLNDNSNRF